MKLIVIANDEQGLSVLDSNDCSKVNRRDRDCYRVAFYPRTREYQRTKMIDGLNALTRLDTVRNI